ncbi:YeeE/YedE family protein [Vibrio sp. SS-MA-C1-2]|uniref:YeeE/YedE family protein n=1 Tax=Vibrio sp. SS-MA-C1-2 TaxID=2908646 RepID=UPI001F228545|nr:YeeE/YedE family protein [Vibrio sp. SS-MA-C1-2]UJF17469.1 YeeE/YedE family protein [Vibrio sp. SS-MA-C1-2]
MFFITALISGLLFGMGMVISGMVDPINVIGFLDIAGDWKPDLAFVMGGALLVFAPTYLIFIKKQKKPLFSETFNLPISQIIDKKLFIGAALFGIGWGLAGICPGPVASSLSMIGENSDILIFFVMMLIGFKLPTLIKR